MDILSKRDYQETRDKFFNSRQYSNINLLYKEDFLKNGTLHGESKSSIQKFLDYHKYLAQVIIEEGYLDKLLDKSDSNQFCPKQAHTKGERTLHKNFDDEDQITKYIYTNRDNLTSLGQVLEYQLDHSLNFTEVNFGSIDLVTMSYTPIDIQSDSRKKTIYLNEAKHIDKRESIIAAALQIYSYFKNVTIDENLLRSLCDYDEIKLRVVIYEDNKKRNERALCNILSKNRPDLYTMQLLNELGVEVVIYNYETDKIRRYFP